MNIGALFLELQDEELQANICGELELKGNCIIWSYDLFESEKITDEKSCYNYDEDDVSLGFETSSNEEILFNAYYEEYEHIKDFMGEVQSNGTEWAFSEPEVIDNMISFKIF